MLSARQAIAQSRSSRGVFDTLWSRRNADGFKPTYNHKPDGDACRIWGTTVVKRVTGMRDVFFDTQPFIDSQQTCT